MAKRHLLETIFAQQAAAGFIVERAGLIRIDRSVENYVQLGGHQIQKLPEAETNQEI